MSPGQPYGELVERATAAARAVMGVTNVWIRLEPIEVAKESGQVVPSPVTARDPPPSDRDDRPLARIDGTPLMLPVDAPRNLADALIRACDTDRGTTYILADGREDRQSYRELLDDAACVLSGLRAHGLRPGDSVLLHCDDNRNFVTGFWACVLGGFVPTPVAVAPTYRTDNSVTRRIRNAWDLLDGPPLLTDRHMSESVAELNRRWGPDPLSVLAIEDIRMDERSADLYLAEPEHPVVHLLTSGSTGIPKCVRHNHRTVITRAYANAFANNFGPRDVTLNFMPLDHVAGMVMHNLRDVVLQCEHINARTDCFMANPLLWLSWIERYGVTNTSAPNFVITLVVNLSEEIAVGSWDLSSLQDITNGGEAIVASTTHQFLRILAPHGLRPDVMRPAWGMSEFGGGVVHSTLRGDDESVGVVTINEWDSDGSLTFLSGPKPGHPTFTEVGLPAPGTSLRIVNSTNATLCEDQIGRLQVRGPTLMVGYYKNPGANTASITPDGWFDTGDLGFVHNGRLVLTGRDKDVLVIRSANYPCHEIETVAADVDGVLPTFVAAGADYDATSGTDELVLFCVFTSGDPRVRRDVIREIRRRIGSEIGIIPRRVIPVARDSFPKTSAGKLERQRLMADYHTGVFDAEINAVAATSDTSTLGSDGMWLFRTVWIPTNARSGPLPAGPWLIFDTGDVADRVREHAPGIVVAVHPGHTWTKQTEVDYWIDPTDQSHYNQLLADVRRQYGDLGAILHSWATEPIANAPNVNTDPLELSALSVHRVIKACGAAAPRMIVLTTGACPVGEFDSVEPLHALVNGLVRTANAEYGKHVIRQVDLLSGDSEFVSHALAELRDLATDDIVAYRTSGRLVARIRPLPPQLSDPSHRIRRGGLYLLTGGLGRIGSRIGELLLSSYGAKLVVNGRSSPTGSRATTLERLEALGDVTYLQADVADVAALREGVAAVEQRLGRTLDGVIHFAGEDIGTNWRDPEMHLLTNEDSAEFRRMYHAKVHGLLALAQVLKDRPEALLIVASSVNGHFGGAAFGPYSSASSFLSAFASYWQRQGRAAQCHSWSLWVERAVTPGRAAIERRGFRPIEPDRGVRLFEAALSDSASNVLIGLDESKPGVITEIDPAVVTEYGFVVTYAGSDAVRKTEVRDKVSIALGSDASLLRVERMDGNATPDPSPFERETLQSPIDELEATIIRVWESTLQQHVSPDDDFFDLGGDSLKAMRLIARINTHLECTLEVQDLYEKPKVSDFAREIRVRMRTSIDTRQEV